MRHTQRRHPELDSGSIKAPSGAAKPRNIYAAADAAFDGCRNEFGMTRFEYKAGMTAPRAA